MMEWMHDGIFREGLTFDQAAVKTREGGAP